MTIDQLIKIIRDEAADQRLMATCYTHLENYRVKAKHDELVNKADNLDQVGDWLEELKKLREDARPQGEWLIDKSFDGWAECNKCHYGLTIFEKAPNFCPNCEAQMRGGGS